MRTRLLSVVSTAALVAGAAAQTIPVPLDYNFNGIVHVGEAGLPDDPNGYRSISDRGLDFAAGVPNDPLLNGYQLIAAPGTLDIVHLGNRNTVDNGNHAFDAVANGDPRGIQPAWLVNVDQSTPQTTVLASPLPIAPSTVVGFLYQISNGGGAFDVTFGFVGGGTYTVTLSGSDWFGGTLPGTQNVDLANPGANLSLTEGLVPMTAFAGQVVGSITFGNRSNPIAGYAIVACNFDYAPTSPRLNQIPLAYNWNGIVHAGEAGNPDDPNGYRSISDRGLDFSAGVPAQALLQPYAFVTTAAALDIVHLGNRNTVSGGLYAFDLLPDGDPIGVQPAWLANPDQTTPQTTTLADRILLDAASDAKVLFQISNGGGSFAVQFTFLSGPPLVATVSGGDWFGGALPGTANVDSGAPGANLSLTERRIDLSAQAGRVLTAISFQNASNTNGGIAIAAMNVGGCIWCVNGTAGGAQNLGGGTGAAMNSSGVFGLGCPLGWTVSGAAPNALGVFAVGLGTASVPLAVALPGCPGTIHTPNPVVVTAITDPFGAASVTLPVPPNQAFCGLVVTAQHYVLGPGACFLLPSDAVAITIGN
jgi:hypothetical protein